MSSEDDCTAPPDALSDALVRELESLNRGELQFVLSYVERRIDERRSPLEAEISASAAGEILGVVNHGAYALVRKHPPSPEESGVDSDVVSLYHVQRESRTNGTDSLHWTYLGDVRGSEQRRCSICGGAFDSDAATSLHSGSEPTDSPETEV